MDMRVLAIGVCVLAASACAATTYAYRDGDHRVSGAIEQPLRDVSLMREGPPEVLVQAAEAPYALPEGAPCSSLLAEVAALDAVLGPDVDASDETSTSGPDAPGLLSSAIRGVVGLPYRSIVRRLTGAERRDRELQDAILSGVARRAFLRGVARGAGCAPGEDLAAAPANPEASASQQTSALTPRP